MTLPRTKNSIFSLLATGLALALTPQAASAASGDTIGEAIEVINLVTADYSRDKRTLQPGDTVRQDEKIAVGSDGRSELEFADRTKIALGPGSELLLDKFVYDSDKNSGSIVMDFVSGTLRFITGVAQKPTYVIRTPNASITVRGTIFDLYTPADDGPTYLLLHEGGVKVCNKNKTCRDNDHPGRLVRISKNGKIDNPTVWSELEGVDGIPFDLAFPFVINPPLIDPSPIFSKDAIINAALPKKKITPRKTYKKKATPKKKKTQRKSQPKKTYTKKKKTRKPTRKAGNNDAAKAAAAAAIAIGIGIAIGSKGKKKGGGGGGCRGSGCGGGGHGKYR